MVTSTAKGEGDAPSQHLTFWLGEEVFGMDIRTVREIIQCGPMAAVPLMPACMRALAARRPRCAAAAAS